MDPRDIRTGPALPVIFLALSQASLAWAVDALSSRALWRQFEADPARHAHIPDNSYAGHRASERAIPRDRSRLIDVKDLGARGDGVADDTAAFSRAIARAERQGGGLAAARWWRTWTAATAWAAKVMASDYRSRVASGRTWRLRRGRLICKSEEAAVGNKKTGSRKKRVTFEQAKKMFKDEWVVFCDANIDLKKGRFIDGVVYWHGSDQQECYRKAAEVRGPGGSFYTGRIPYRQVTLTEDDARRKRVA